MFTITDSLTLTSAVLRFPGQGVHDQRRVRTSAACQLCIRAIGEGVPRVGRRGRVFLWSHRAWSRGVHVRGFESAHYYYEYKPDETRDRLIQNTLAVKYGHRPVYLLSTFLVRADPPLVPLSRCDR